jgi:dihydroxycyclohexadiene carboxylate dehydrogenase
MSTRFAGKVMVVTGAAQGIGRAVAEGAAAEGARVLIVDRSPHRTEVVRAIRKAGGVAEAISVNLETWAGCAKAMAKAAALWGRIDILVNNVGGTIWAKPFEHYEALPRSTRNCAARCCRRSIVAARRLITCCPKAKA